MWDGEAPARVLLLRLFILSQAEEDWIPGTQIAVVEKLEGENCYSHGTAGRESIAILFSLNVKCRGWLYGRL